MGPVYNSNALTAYQTLGVYELCWLGHLAMMATYQFKGVKFGPALTEFFERQENRARSLVRPDRLGLVEGLLDIYRQQHAR